mmetsp:Transcript_13917/g.23596  ORF Transcript_13917/g.23596 Transcript_13917/m.23596 type:complete len:160 (-) Transcript_13917:257-736(-)
MYREGNGVAPDDAAAVDLYRLAGENGFAQAQFSLGELYSQGEGGLPVDANEAAKWYKLAANQGHRKALYVLGLMTEYGDGGIEQSGRIACRLYALAAAQGHSQAHFQLGVILAQGVLVPQDVARAKYHLSTAHELGVEQAGEVLEHEIFREFVRGDNEH